jgi:hypothetical protein
MQLAEKKVKDSFLIDEKCIFLQSQVPFPYTNFSTARSRALIGHNVLNASFALERQCGCMQHNQSHLP